MGTDWIVRPFAVALLASALTAPFAGAAAAQAGLDGRALARSWCSSCHVVEPGLKGTDIAPSFITIANDPAYTRRRIENWLFDPHPPMPQLHLSRPEIESVTSYILGLRGKR